MEWLRELVTVPRMLLYFLFGIGFAYTLETIVRLLTKPPETMNHHVDNRDKYPEQEGFKEKATEIKRIVSRDDIEKQKDVTQTKDKPDYHEGD